MRFGSRRAWGGGGGGLRGGIIHAKPADELIYRGCWYGLALAPLGGMLARTGGGAGRPTERKVAFDGFEATIHEDKNDPDPPHPTVSTLPQYPNPYLLPLHI